MITYFWIAVVAFVVLSVTADARIALFGVIWMMAAYALMFAIYRWMTGK